MYLTNPIHGGKVTCHRCNGFIEEKDAFENDEKFFHIKCRIEYLTEQMRKTDSDMLEYFALLEIEELENKLNS